MREGGLQRMEEDGKEQKNKLEVADISPRTVYPFLPATFLMELWSNVHSTPYCTTCNSLQNRKKSDGSGGVGFSNHRVLCCHCVFMFAHFPSGGRQVLWLSRGLLVCSIFSCLGATQGSQTDSSFFP